jgi:hypothetical protein
MVTLDFLALCAYFVAPLLFVWQLAAQQLRPLLPQALPAAVRTYACVRICMCCLYVYVCISMRMVVARA